MSPPRRAREEAEERIFAQAMEGVAPLADRPARVERGKRRQRRRSPSPSAPSSAAFAIERLGERIEALAPDAERSQLTRLSNMPVDLRLDLHGMTEKVARDAVREALGRAADAGMRCLLIIHGRGRRSPTGPVLKEALPDWLAGDSRGRVLAFASAGPGLGGTGATLVLLRRRCRPRSTGTGKR